VFEKVILRQLNTKEIDVKFASTTVTLTRWKWVRFTRASSSNFLYSLCLCLFLFDNLLGLRLFNCSVVGYWRCSLCLDCSRLVMGYFNWREAHRKVFFVMCCFDKSDQIVEFVIVDIWPPLQNTDRASIEGLLCAGNVTDVDFGVQRS